MYCWCCLKCNHSSSKCNNYTPIKCNNYASLKFNHSSSNWINCWRRIRWWQWRIKWRRRKCYDWCWGIRRRRSIWSWIWWWIVIWRRRWSICRWRPRQWRWSRRKRRCSIRGISWIINIVIISLITLIFKNITKCNINIIIFLYLVNLN